MRENSSRPRSSTPNQYSPEGPGQQPPLSNERFCARGSYGAISGANSASRTKRPTSAKPTSAPGFRRRRCHASRQSPLGASSWTSRASISARLTGTPAVRRSRVADPWVDDRVHDVDDQVDEHEDDRDEQDPALQDGKVAHPDRVHEPGADPRPGENRFREHGS